LVSYDLLDKPEIMPSCVAKQPDLSNQT